MESNNEKKFIMADFDDTIFAREQQLNKEKILRENMRQMNKNNERSFRF